LVAAAAPAGRPAGGASADGASAGGAFAAGAGDHRELTGEILLVEELGADALMHVRLTGEGGSDDGTVVARTEGRKSPAPGQQVSFRVRPDDVFAFNPETGARLI
jgi:ABC-type sugar transport system ATPase subunit